MAGEPKRGGHAVVGRVVGTIFATIAVVLGLLSLIGAIWSAKQVARFAADVVRTCSTTAAWELSLAFGVLGVTLILLSTKGAPKLRNWFGPRVVGRVLGGGVLAVMVGLAFLALFIKHAVSRHPTTSAVVPPSGLQAPTSPTTTQPAEPAPEEHSTPAVNRTTVASTGQPNQVEPTVAYEPVASTANVSAPEGAPEAPSEPAASSEEAPPSKSSSEESSTPTYNSPNQPSSESPSVSSSPAQASASASSSSSDEVNVSTSTSSVSVSSDEVNVSTPGSSVSVSANGVSVSTASSSISVE